MIERLNTTQSGDGGERKRKAAVKATRAEIGKSRKTKTSKPKSSKKPAKRAEKKPEAPSTIGKVFSMAELIAMKRDELERVAKERGVTQPHLLKNKQDLAQAIGVADDVVLEGGLTQKQDLFCQLYAGDVEFFGNGVQSYVEAYHINLAAPGAYDSARSAAARLLANVNVLDRIDEIMQDHEMNDIMVDKSTAFWIRQKANPQASVAAIKIYNEVKGRVGKRGSELPKVLILQQNQQIHFDSPKAKGVIEAFDQWLLDNTKAPQPSEREANAQTAQVVQ